MVLKRIFQLPPSSALLFTSWGSWGVKKQILLSQQWKKKMLQELPEALQPIMASAHGTLLVLPWSITLATPVKWVVNPQDQPILLIDLLLLQHGACNRDTVCMLIAFSPVNSSICNWKKKKGLQAQQIIPQKNWRHCFQQMCLFISHVQNEQNTYLLFLHSTWEILKTTELNPGSRKWNWSDK